jgi:tRNA(His) guanylyltransferase
MGEASTGKSCKTQMCLRNFNCRMLYDMEIVLFPQTSSLSTSSHQPSRLSDRYGFEKPNDIRALNLMNAAAMQVMTVLADLTIAYGVSDEFSFVFHRSTNLFERRASKLVSTIVSTFTAAYVYLWAQYFPGTELLVNLLPTFDGRAVCYPSVSNLRDYLSWRQVDCELGS